MNDYTISEVYIKNDDDVLFNHCIYVYHSYTWLIAAAIFYYIELLST